MNKKLLKQILEEIVMDIPVIFLDLDGVLVSLNEQPQLLDKIHVKPNWLFELEKFDPLCVKQMNRLENETGARVILSSSWRHSFTPDEMDTIFKFNGLHFKLSGVTKSFAYGEREKEIQEYIDSHRISKYIVIDDLPLNIPNLVRCGSQGLTKELADEGIRILT